ncbi:hypothetical protein J7T55_005343 [Diaporthe amygdali]|uniref:uncharacterized protein n=1 Tax=Phomopsis amygdali TaxID=1214568 RepID=UPI0022FDEDF6|nr:uncharacterized protein J7T55_005343 [Diaporthe amygdali]KAJ0108366.1 hypothetical protein J7T55_005343 [Diaporthe amygdali]
MALANFNGTISLNLLPTYEKSLYYTQDESHVYSWRTPSFFPSIKKPYDEKSVDLCDGFPQHLLNRIQVVLKTGTGETEKTKAHLETVSSCITNLLVFSDLEETVAGHHFIDILADLPPSYQSQPDFAAYSAQKQAHSEGRPVGYSSEGWKLDRFKFLPMVDKMYQMRPRADWYAFIEADVYYFWDTLFRLLDQLDPSKMHYMGSSAAGRDGTFFAYGGAGFVLSRGLMKRLVGDSTQLSARYEDYAVNDCCGDAALGYAIMNKTGEPLQALYPTFAGDELNGLKVNQERWCIPLLALHRVTPGQMKSLWGWERTRPYDENAFTHSTLSDYLLSRLDASTTRGEWDNYADRLQPEDSPAHSFGGFFQMGRPVPGSDYTSGWDMDKILSLGYQEDPDKTSSCKEATWLKPDIR